ncbi:hypothetical protein BJX96DRAFT_120684 [Aspergillus floccosus]
MISEIPRTFFAHSRTGHQRYLSSPGGLSLDVQPEHALSLTEERRPLSYAELTATMTMIKAAADTDGRYDMRNVGIVSVNGPARFLPGAPMCIFMGFVGHYFPVLHSYLPSTGPG